MTLRVPGRPTTFDLVNYAPLESFSVADWAGAIWHRLIVQRAPRRGPREIRAADGMLENLMRAPMDYPPLPIESRSMSGPTPRGLWSMTLEEAREVASDLDDHGLRDDPFDVISDEPFDVLPDASLLGDESRTFGVVRAGSQGWTGRRDAPIEYLCVDLDAPTDMLKKEFVTWLKAARKARDLARPRIDFAGWIEHRLLPYFDLRVYAQAKGLKWSREELGELLFFPDVDRDEKYLTDTVRERVQEVVSWPMCRRLCDAVERQEADRA